jgi:hypothetical protein
MEPAAVAGVEAAGVAVAGVAVAAEAVAVGVGVAAVVVAAAAAPGAARDEGDRTKAASRGRSAWARLARPCLRPLAAKLAKGWRR